MTDQLPRETTKGRACAAGHCSHRLLQLVDQQRLLVHGFQYPVAHHQE